MPHLEAASKANEAMARHLEAADALSQPGR